MIPPSFYRVSIKGLAVDDAGRFLLAREPDGQWDMLGGGLDYDKNPIDELKREITEETGLTVTSISPSPKYFITAYKLEKDVYIANVIYEMTLENLDFTPSDECEELRYFSVEEAKEIDLLPNMVEFLKVYNADLHL